MHATHSLLISAFQRNVERLRPVALPVALARAQTGSSSASPMLIQLTDECSLAPGVTCLGARGERPEIVLELAFGPDYADPDFSQRVVVEPTSPLLTYKSGSTELVLHVDQGTLFCWLLNSTLPG